MKDNEDGVDECVDDKLVRDSGDNWEWGCILMMKRDDEDIMKKKKDYDELLNVSSDDKVLIDHGCNKPMQECGNNELIKKSWRWADEEGEW